LHLSFVLQHVHVLLASVCTAAGLEAMMVFVLCAIYSRGALAIPRLGDKLFDHFLKKTTSQRKLAFLFIVSSSVLCSANLIVYCMSMCTWVMEKVVPAICLNLMTGLCSAVIFILTVTIVVEMRRVIDACSIIFLPQDKMDEVLAEETRLLEEAGKPMNTDTGPGGALSVTYPHRFQRLRDVIHKWFPSCRMATRKTFSDTRCTVEA